MNHNVIELLAKRRTIRHYTDEPVPEETIVALLEAALYAPSYLNRRPAHYLVVQDKAVRERLGAILSVRPYVQQASAVILLLADPELSLAWPADLAAAGENILIAATGLGLGAAWVGNPFGAAWETREAEIRELLDIPDRMRMLGLITVGYAAESPDPHTKQEVWDNLRVHYMGALRMWAQVGATLTPDKRGEV